MTATAACPLCSKRVDPAHAPFCSRGCKDRDLLRWLGEGYALPGTPAGDEAGMPATRGVDRPIRRD